MSKTVITILRVTFDLLSANFQPLFHSEIFQLVWLQLELNLKKKKMRHWTIHEQFCQFNWNPVHCKWPKQYFFSIHNSVKIPPQNQHIYHVPLYHPQLRVFFRLHEATRPYKAQKTDKNLNTRKYPSKFNCKISTFISTTLHVSLYVNMHSYNKKNKRRTKRFPRVYAKCRLQLSWQKNYPTKRIIS